MKQSQFNAGFSQVNKAIFGKFGDFPLNALSVLFLVPEKGSISLSELARLLDLSQASLSRNAALLSGLGRRRADAAEIKLTELSEDPSDRRVKRIALTDEGRAYKQELAEVFAKYSGTTLE